MGAFLVKQPNGLYCRFSTSICCPTSWNMTEEEYIKMCVERAKKNAEREAREEIEHCSYTIDDMIRDFQPNVMTKAKFKKVIKEISANDQHSKRNRSGDNNPQSFGYI